MNANILTNQFIPEISLEKIQKIVDKTWESLPNKPYSFIKLEGTITSKLCASFPYFSKETIYHIVNQLKIKNLKFFLLNLDELKSELLKRFDWICEWAILPQINRSEHFFKKNSFINLDYLFEGHRKSITDIFSSINSLDFNRLIDLIISKNQETKLLWDEIFSPKSQKNPYTFWDESTFTPIFLDLYEIERIRSLDTFFQKFLDNEFSKVDILKIEHFGNIVQNIKKNWKLSNLFESQFKVMQSRLKEKFDMRINEKISILEKELESLLLEFDLNSSEAFSKYTLIVNNSSSAIIRKLKELMGQYHVQLAQNDILTNVFIQNIKRTRIRIRHIEHAFLSHSFEYLESELNKLKCQNTSQNAFEGVPSGVLERIFTKIRRTRFKDYFKEITIKKILLNVQKISFAKKFNFCCSMKSVLQRCEKIFSLLNCSNTQNKSLRNLFHDFQENKHFFMLICFELFPLISSTSLLDVLFETLINIEYIKKTKQSILNIWSPEILAPEAQSQGVRITKLEVRRISYLSTIFFSGYTSQDYKYSDVQWKQSMQFFFRGNLIVGKWNSQKMWSVGTQFLYSFAKLIPEIMINQILSPIYHNFQAYIRPSSQQPGFKKKITLIEDQKKLFTDAYQNALKEGSKIYQIIKSDKAENSRLIQMGSFSLGTVINYSFLKQASLDTNNSLVIGDIMLMGGCISQSQLESLLPDLLQYRGFCTGTIFVVHSKEDYILRYLFCLYCNLTGTCSAFAILIYSPWGFMDLIIKKLAQIC